MTSKQKPAPSTSREVVVANLSESTTTSTQPQPTRVEEDDGTIAQLIINNHTALLT